MVVRGLLYLGLGGASLWGVSKAHSEGGLDPSNLGIVRFGRAAKTVALIGYDYKRTLSAAQHLKTEAELALQKQHEEEDKDIEKSTKSSSRQIVDEGESAYELAKKACHQRAADRMLELCCANGGCFIKVGQHIGALDYLLPEEYVSTMRVLHHRAPEMDLEDVYGVIREDLKAEVHKATLRSTGETVAVKVQHRHVKNHSFVDIYTMDFLVRAVKFAFPQFEFMWLADEMRKNLPLELSFTQEGRNAEKIQMLLEHHDWLKVPEIHWEQTTDRVLTMEYCEGGHVNDVSYLRRHGLNPQLISSRISQMYADMIFKLGYVHCDPHPGNILVARNERSEE